MWRTANPLKVAATRGYGAEVDLEAENAAEAYERLLAHVEETGAVFVHPFDDPVLHAGHGSLGLEVLEDVPEAAVVVVPVGGGGLIAGVATAVKGSAPGARGRRRARGRGDDDRGAGGREVVPIAPKIDRRRPGRTVHRRARSPSAATSSTRSCS